jgi:hypothetical protein
MTADLNADVELHIVIAFDHFNRLHAGEVRRCIVQRLNDESMHLSFCCACEGEFDPQDLLMPGAFLVSLPHADPTTWMCWGICRACVDRADLYDVCVAWVRHAEMPDAVIVPPRGALQ